MASPKGQIGNNIEDEMALRGILSKILNGEPQDQRARLEQAAEDARDVTGLVKKKRPENQVEDESTNQTGVAKRKADASTSHRHAAKRFRSEEDVETPSKS